MIGQRFGKLTVVAWSHATKYRGKNKEHWLCRCDCGNEKVVLEFSLKYNHTKSCGCNKIEGGRKAAKKLLAPDPRLVSARNIFNHYKDGNLTFEQFLRLSQKLCHYCQSDLSNSYNRYSGKRSKNTTLENIDAGIFRYNGLDRIDNTRPHDLDNVVPCCKICNSAKNIMTLEEFKNWSLRVYKHFFGQKETDSSKLESVSELVQLAG